MALNNRELTVLTLAAHIRLSEPSYCAPETSVRIARETLNRLPAHGYALGNAGDLDTYLKIAHEVWTEIVADDGVAIDDLPPADGD